MQSPAERERAELSTVRAVFLFSTELSPCLRIGLIATSLNGAGLKGFKP